jgi:hypothetical protein
MEAHETGYSPGRNFHRFAIENDFIWANVGIGHRKMVVTRSGKNAGL